jgi:hypothetical protein
MGLAEFLLEACTHSGPDMPGFKATRYFPDLIRSVLEGSLHLAPLKEYGARSMRKTGTQSGVSHSVAVLEYLQGLCVSAVVWFLH